MSKKENAATTSTKEEVKLKWYKRGLWKVEGDKEVFQIKRLFHILLSALGLFILVIMLMPEKDSSVLGNSHKPLGSNNNSGYPIGSSQSEHDKSLNSLFENSKKREEKKSKKTGRRSRRGPRIKINYRAKQVINRNGVRDDPDEYLPMGTNIVGKLLTSIDTRETGRRYKVLLPFGAHHKNGVSIPKHTVLHASISYPGKGRKVFMSFERGVLPSGEEFAVQAQALNSKDYAPGLIGQYHGKAGSRLAATLGLTMLSGVAEVMTEKHALGENGQETTTAKSSLKNGIYNGLAKATELEASRQLNELGGEPEYVTIRAGKELIVNLTERIRLNDYSTKSKQEQ